MPDDRLHRYAWEAAHLASRHPVRHAVAVLEERCRDGCLPLGGRNTETFCRRPIGQRVDAVHLRSGGVRCRPHLQLHRAADIAHLERCRACLAHMEQRCYRERGSRFEEWHEDLPLFPGHAVLVDGPCPAYWPTYYRYRVEPAGVRWVPEVRWRDPVGDIARATMDAGLPASAMLDVTQAIGEFAGAAGLQAAMLADDEAGGAREWHLPRRTPEELAAIRRQVEAGRRRERDRQRHLLALETNAGLDLTTDLVRLRRPDADEREAIIQAEARALQLAEDVLPPAAHRSLVEHGYVDLASGLNPPCGYRIRPWRRVGLLLWRASGWYELGASLCLHPDELYPSADEVVAMWLRLRWRERETLALANLHSEAA